MSRLPRFLKSLQVKFNQLRCDRLMGWSPILTNVRTWLNQFIRLTYVGTGFLWAKLIDRYHCSLPNCLKYGMHSHSCSFRHSSDQLLLHLITGNPVRKAVLTAVNQTAKGFWRLYYKSDKYVSKKLEVVQSFFSAYCFNVYVKVICNN